MRSTSKRDCLHGLVCPDERLTPRSPLVDGEGTRLSCLLDRKAVSLSFILDPPTSDCCLLASPHLQGRQRAPCCRSVRGL